MSQDRQWKQSMTKTLPPAISATLLNPELRWLVAWWLVLVC